MSMKTATSSHCAEQARVRFWLGPIERIPVFGQLVTVPRHDNLDNTQIEMLDYGSIDLRRLFDGQKGDQIS